MASANVPARIAEIQGVRNRLLARKSQAPATSEETRANQDIDNDVLRLHTIEAALQELQAVAAAGAAQPAQAPQVDLTDYVAIQAYIEQRQAVRPEVPFEDIRREIAALVRQEKSLNPASPIVLRNATIAEELWYYRQVGGRNQDNVRHDLKALEKIPIFLAEETDPCKLDAKWRAMELPFIMAVRNRHISEEDLKTALMSRMQGNAEQFLLAQPNITNLTFDQILTLCRARFYVTENQAAARTKTTYQLEKESVQVYAERLQVASLQLLPTRPSQIKGLVVRNNPNADGLTAMPIPNPFQIEDSLRYENDVKTVGRTLITDFVKGLKAQIRQKLHSVRLDQLSFQEVVAAAVHEERFAADFPEQSARSAYALEAEDEQAYAMGEKGCFQCHDPNHWIKDCPQLKNLAGRRGKVPMRGRLWNNERNYAFSKDNRQPQQQASGNYSRSIRFRGGKGFSGIRGSGNRRGQQGVFRGNWRSLPRSYRNNNRRKWMIATRAALNRRMQYRRRVYNLTEEENEDEIPYTEEEEQLFQLEAEAEADSEWYAQYKEDVARFEDDASEGESKNGQ
jgi:hypothetical protein